MTLELGYLGSHGVHLQRSHLINNAPAGPGAIGPRRPFKTLSFLPGMVLPDNITIANTTSYKVSPNPFHDKLKVVFGNSSGQLVNARLTDVSGKTLLQKNSIAVSGSALEFELSSLPAGVYILRLFDGRSIQVFKVIKK